MENSVPAGQKIPTLHHPEEINPEQMFFDESRVHELILDKTPAIRGRHRHGVFAADR
jgi:hypothetical protein